MSLKMPKLLKSLTVSTLISCLTGSAFAGRADLYTRQSDQSISVIYSLEIERDGKTTKSTGTYTVKEGDNIRMRVQPNVDGYIYVLASGAEDGHYDILYPAGGAVAKPVQKGQIYLLPQSGIKVGTSPNQNVRMIFSKSKIDLRPGRLISIAGRLSLPFETTRGKSTESEKGTAVTTDEPLIPLEIMVISESP